ncbi:MAG TPA: hypothetical protein VK513_09545 [Terriglobales bacterium]|nr:hypothetical protein [Terriglobales bacterium]
MGKSIHAMGHDLVDRAPIIAVDVSSRLFLGGLRSRRACLRFTGRAQNAIK